MSGEKFYIVAVDETNAVSVGDWRLVVDEAFIRSDREETNRRACGGVAP